MGQRLGCNDFKASRKSGKSRYPERKNSPHLILILLFPCKTSFEAKEKPTRHKAVAAETKLHIGCVWPPAPPIISGVHHSVPSTNPPSSISCLSLGYIRPDLVLWTSSIFRQITMNPEW